MNARFVHCCDNLRPQRSMGRSAITTLALAWVVATPASAFQVRQAVQAKHGEMVLVRSVPTRIATRPAPDGVATLIDPSPRRQIQQALGAQGGELSDAEYAAIDSGPTQRTKSILKTETGTLTTGPGGNPATRMPVQGATGSLSPLGAVGSNARAAGDQLRSALGALPLPVAGGQGGH